MWLLPVAVRVGSRTFTAVPPFGADELDRLAIAYAHNEVIDEEKILKEFYEARHPETRRTGIVTRVEERKILNPSEFSATVCEIEKNPV